MNVKISRILHAGYIFEFEGYKIAFDPIFENPFSRNCYAYPNVRFDYEIIKILELDAIFISHYHDDHCSFESLKYLNRNIPIYIFCVFDEMIDMLKSLGFKTVISLDLSKEIRIGPFAVTPHRALDEDIDSILQVTVGDINILNVVDSWIDPVTMNNLKRISAWDLILWPFQTMRELEVLSPLRENLSQRKLPGEWIEQLKELRPKYLVPSSCQFIHEEWSWYRKAYFPITYSYFKTEVEHHLPDCQVVRMNPSTSFELNKNSFEISTSLSWIIPVGDQVVDYEYDSQAIPTSTSQIAQRFPALTKYQTNQVYEYCENEIPKKLKSMDTPLDSYFKTKRYWKLVIYDHEGVAKNYYYLLDAKCVRLENEKKALISWSTELPIARLYGAIFDGESLSSMYLRINDEKFSDEIEKEICNVELTEDPLLRCLFNGSFGSYQKAQLRRIKSEK